MSKKRKLCSGQKKAGAVIYLNANNVDGRACEECLDQQEACCRRYCTGEKLKILRIFRETSESPETPYQYDEMGKFISEHCKEGSILVIHTLEGRKEYLLGKTEDYESDVRTD